MKTDQKATSTTLFNGEYTYLDVRNTIEKIVTTNNYTDRRINLMVNIDGLHCLSRAACSFGQYL